MAKPLNFRLESVIQDIEDFVFILFSKKFEIICLTALLLFCYILFIKIRRKSLKTKILLTGLNDSGKTLLFSHLVGKTFVHSYTSLKPNICEYSIAQKDSWSLVDLPGHIQLRKKYFDQFKSQAKAIIFVIDSLTITKDIKDVASFLYDILTDECVRKLRPNFLVLCNKQDEPLSKAPQAVRAMLEMEITKLRSAHSQNLVSNGRSLTKETFLGRKGKDFQFDEISIPIRFLASSAAAKPELDLSQLEDWLMKVK